MVKVCTSKQLEHLEELLSSGGDVSIAVAYVRQSGLSLIEDELTTALSKSEVRMLISLDGRTTEPAAVKKLFELTEKGLKARFFDVPSREYAIFHPKLYISRSGESTTFLTGSYNLTGAALLRNREHGLRVTCSNSEKEGKEALEYFNGLWEDDLAKCLTRAAVDDYAERYVRVGYAPPGEELPNQNYWLIKCNPAKHEGYTFCHLLVSENRRDYWSENITLQESIDYISEMKIGDLALFQHSGYSNARDNVVVGTVRVVREAYECPNDPTKKVIDIQVESEFARPIPLSEIRGFYPGLRDNPPIQQVKVSRNTWDEIVCRGMEEANP